MKKYIRILLLIGLLPSIASAETIGSKKIDKLHVNSSSGIYFSITEPVQNSGLCSSGSGGYYRLEPGTLYEKDIYSLLMAAKMSGKEITFHVSSSSCTGNYPKVEWVRVND